MSNKNIIGDRLYYLREQADLTIDDMSKALDISKGHISEMESGKSMPSMQTLMKICEFYKITISEFFMDEGMLIDLTLEQRKLLSLTKYMEKEQIEHLNKFIEIFYKT